MLPFEKALETVLANTPLLPPCRFPLNEICGQYLAEGVIAPFDVPRFSSTSVDGFAVRLADLAEASAHTPVRLHIEGSIRAGDPACIEIASGTAAKVFTGSPLPANTEAVVMKEQTEVQDGHVAVACTAHLGENIRPRSAEFRKGQTVLAQGTRISPPVIGLLASLGYSSAVVRRQPRIALITTGNELVPPGCALNDAQVYDSNSAALAAALSLIPVEMVEITHVADDPVELQRVIGLALMKADVLITVGGASVGEYDFVKNAFTANGVQLLFTTVAMKPGKPTVFGTHSLSGNTKLVFGLPGNPVSALVCFHHFVRSAIRKMLGASEVLAPRMTANLGSNLKRAAGRLEFVRGRLINRDGQWIAYATSAQDSHMLGGIAEADVLIHFPADATELRTGQSVVVERLEW